MFQKLINFSKTLEELVLTFYNSIQDYFDYKSIYDFIYPRHYDFCNVNVCHSLYYSTEYVSDNDEENGMCEFAETVQNDRAMFCSSYNDFCRINGVLDKFYLN